MDTASYISRSKDGRKGVFTRDRKLNLRKLYMFLLTTKTALQRDLDRFYKALSNDDFNIREITKGALSQSRSKLNPWAFQRLNEVTVETFYQSTLVYTWYGL